MRKYFFKNFIFLSKTDNYHRIYPFFLPNKDIFSSLSPQSSSRNMPTVSH